MTAREARLLRMAVNDRAPDGYARLAARAGLPAWRVAGLMSGARGLNEGEAAQLWAVLMDWSWR